MPTGPARPSTSTPSHHQVSQDDARRDYDGDGEFDVGPDDDPEGAGWMGRGSIEDKAGDGEDR